MRRQEKKMDLNNQQIGNEQSALPPSPHFRLPAPPQLSVDFIDDDTNAYQYPPNPPYNYGGVDEWPRIEI